MQGKSCFFFLFFFRSVSTSHLKVKSQCYDDDGTPIKGGCRRPSCAFVHPTEPAWASAAIASSSRTFVSVFAHCFWLEIGLILSHFLGDRLVCREALGVERRGE